MNENGPRRSIRMRSILRNPVRPRFNYKERNNLILTLISVDLAIAVTSRRTKTHLIADIIHCPPRSSSKSRPAGPGRVARGRVRMRLQRMAMPTQHLPCWIAGWRYTTCVRPSVRHARTFRSKDEITFPERTAISPREPSHCPAGLHGLEGQGLDS